MLVRRSDPLSLEIIATASPFFTSSSHGARFCQCLPR